MSDERPKHPKIEIRSRWNANEILYSTDTCLDLKSAVEEAVSKKTDLGYANLRYANLRYANLRSADLGSANLRSADLGSADLGSARINWQSHALISRILLVAAGEDVEKRKIAGLILVSTDWCWEGWIGLRRTELFSWAIDEMAAYVQPDDNAPGILRERAAKLKAATFDAIPVTVHEEQP
jgi:hypothetical protein